MGRLFKKGDLVECIDNSGFRRTCLTNGKIYEVSDSDGDIVYVSCDDSIIRFFKPFRFKLHKSEWIKWDGGECPVDRETLVEVKMRDGYTVIGKAKYGVWANTSLDYDIVAYRIVEPDKEKAAEEQPEQVDMVNNPPHYKQGGIECIEAIKAALTEEEFRGYCKGNAIKYIWREKHKGGNESIEKANWYLNKL